MPECRVNEHRFNVDPQGPIMTRLNVPKVAMLITPCQVCGMKPPKELLADYARALAKEANSDTLRPEMFHWTVVDKLPGGEDPQAKAAAGNTVMLNDADPMQGLVAPADD